MPNLFARRTTLSDVMGRLDYISNPLKQENLLATYDKASDLLDGHFWEILAKESQESFKQYGATKRTVKGKDGQPVEQELKCTEGMEVFFLLGRELMAREDLSPDDILRKAIDAISDFAGVPAAGALQLNETGECLHIHAILPWRKPLDEPTVKVAERNLFFDAEGKRRYKKGEILDKDGNLIPGCRIVKKGEIYESRCFSSVNKEMMTEEWLKDLKTNCILKLRNGVLKGDVEITEYDPSTGMLPQQYIGNKLKDEAKKARIQEENKLVREYNEAVKDGIVSHEEALEVQAALLGVKDKYDDLLYVVERIRERRAEELEEEEDLLPRKDSLTTMMSGAESQLVAGYTMTEQGIYWKKYKDIRDETWDVFLQGQRTEFRAIRKCQEDLKDLRFQNSHAVKTKDGTVEYRLNSPKKLEANGYFDDRDKIKEDLNKHKKLLAQQRKYQEVAKGRQKIVRALLLAGAEKSVIDSAMREYEAAMNLLQNHVNDPEFDYENRRLKVAQTSLAMAQARAERYIQKLEEEKLQEENALENQVDKEYQDFREDGTIVVDTNDGSKAKNNPELQVEVER